MSDDFQRYFNSRLNQEIERDAQQGISTKYLEVQQAADRKIKALGELRQQATKIRQLQQDSLVGKLGIDPNSTLGTVANTAVATVGDAGDIAAGLIVPPLELTGQDEAAAAFREALQPEGLVAPRLDTGEEQSGLFRRLGDLGVAGAKSVVNLGDAVVGVGDIATLGLSGKGWDAWGRDSKRTHAALDDLYSPEQRLANQAVEDAPGFVGTVDAMLGNPSTITTGIIESLATMVAGGKIGQELLGQFPRVAALLSKAAPSLPGLTASTAGAIGEGVLMAGSQAEGIRQETEDQTLSFKQALLAAGTGVMGAGVAAVGGKLSKTARVGDIDTAIVEGALAKTPRGYLTSTGLAAGIEAGEEAAQSAGESILKNIALDKQWDEGVGKAAAQGMLTAAPLGAVAGLGERIKVAAVQQTNAQTREKAQEAAVASGDTSVLLDPKNAAYAPSGAIAALSGNSALPTTTPEAKQANLTKASDIVAKLQDEFDTAKAALESVDPEAVVQRTKDSEAYKARLVTETNPDRIAAIKGIIADNEAMNAEVPQVPVKELAKRREAVQAAQRRLNEATEAFSKFNEDLGATESKATDIAAQVAAVEAPVDEKDTTAVAARSAAASKLIVLSMAIPENLDPKVAASLASNTANGLTNAQRSYLRAFSEARVVDNQTKDAEGIAKEVYYGGSGNAGIIEHRRRIAAALASGNEALATKALKTLQNFEEDHRGKAEMAAEALSRHQATGKNIQAIRNQATKAWEINTGGWLNKKQAAINGAVTVHANTPAKWIKSIAKEATAITTAYAEMQAAYALTFQPQGATNVPVVPQASAPATNPVPVQQEAEAVGSNESVAGAVGTPAVEPGTGSSGVEATGVVAASPVARVAEKTEQISIPDAVKKMTDAQLNSALEAEMEKPNHVKNRRFRVLDAEMKLREDQAYREMEAEENSTDSQASPDAATVSNQSTEDASASVQEADVEVSSESAEQTEEVADGKLSALSEKSEEGTAFGLRNIIADYFTQTASREGDATKRPLVAMKDFLSQGWDSIMSFVQYDKLSEEQVKALSTFWSTAEGWSETIQQNLFRKKSREYWVIDDLSQFFITETEQGRLDLEENLKTAMSYAAYSWVAENATRSMFNTDEEINTILGRDEDHPVEGFERQALLHVGTRQNVIVNTLGQRAVQALGLKATKAAPRNLMPKLESALGAHIFKLLMDRGILKRNTVSAKDMAVLTGSAATNEGAEHQFLKLARDQEGKLTSQAEEIFQANKGTQNILDKLFSVESAMKEPTLEPVPFTQVKTRNTNQAVPKKLTKIMEHENAGASYVRQDMYHLVSELDEVIALQIAGGVSAGSADAHLVNRRRNEAKNDGLLREIRNVKDFLTSLVLKDSDLAMPIYFEHSVWKQQRVGISTNMVNPQTSKVHRHMLFRKSWETKVDRNDAAQMENFHLRVAEGLGVKTDKQSNTASLVQLYEKKLTNAEIQAAVQVLQKSLRGETLSQNDQEVLLAGVKAGGENFHSLDALMSLAHLAKAVEAKVDSFTVQMMGEVDGVTNGPMLSHLLMGAANSVSDLFGLLNRGGFYEVGNEHNQYNLWRGAEGHFDLYETTAGHMVTSVQELVSTGIKSKKGKVLLSPGAVGQVMAAIYGFTGTLADKDGRVQKAGRNIIKTPLTAMVFGSSVTAAVESMANNFIESIYAGIEDTAQQKDGAQTTEQLIENINLLLKEGWGPTISARLTITQLMELEFSQEQTEALKRIFKMTVGGAVRTTMETDFAPYIAQRKQFNLAAQVSFEIYNAAYTALREQLVNELVTSGEITVNAKTKAPLHDLNAAQEAELRKRLSKMEPVIHTLMSKDSGSLKAGLYMAKSGKKLSTDGTFEGSVQFGTSFTDNKAKSTSTRGFDTVEAAPGVAMAPMSVHSLDSAISHYAAMLGEVLNVHDAHGAGLTTFEQTAKNLNQATWNAMLNYSPASQMQEAMSRTVMAFAEMVKEGSLPESTMTNLVKGLTEIANKEKVSPDVLVGGVLRGMKYSAHKADSTKLQALEQMQAIDQYALQGGNYMVTEKDRAAAAARRAALSDALSEEEEAALETIEKALSKQFEGVTTETVETPLEEDPPVQKTGETRESPFGELGTPAKVNTKLVEFFKKNPEPSVKDTLALLETMLVGNNEFKRLLVGMLRRSMPANIKIKILTKDSSAISKEILPEGWGKAYGKFVDDTVYLLNEDFVNSALVTTEVVLHELVHAALAQLVHREQQLNNPKSDGLKLVQELDDLRLTVLAHVKQNAPKDLTTLQSKLGDVHEFIAYGMTQRSFQKLLSEVSVPAKTTPGSLVNGFKDFVNKLVGLLFKESTKTQQEQLNTALAVLIEDVSALFAQGTAEQVSDREITQQNRLNLSMVVNPVGTVSTYTTMDIHNSLNAGAVSPAFDLKLRDILGGIVETLHGPFGTFKAALMKDQALSAHDVWVKALATGVAPFASSVQTSPLQSSEQEQFAMEQVEATVREVLSRSEATATTAYRELNKLFVEATKLVKPSDFATQDEYDFIFKVEVGANGRSEHLARFAAFGLAHEQVNKLLQRNTAVGASKPKTIGERMVVVWEDILRFFQQKITGTYGGQRADLKLNQLVGVLVDIEAKRRLQIARRAGSVDLMAPIEKGAKKIVDAGIAKVVDIAGSNFVRTHTSPIVQAAGSGVRMIAGQRLDKFFEAIADMRAQAWKDRLGFVAGTMNYAMSGSKVMEALLRARKMVEGERKDIITGGSKMALQAFANQGKGITRPMSEAISQVFLRTGMHVLRDQFNLAQLENLLGNKPAMDAEIDALENQLNGFGALKDDYIHQANALGYFKATGRNKTEVLMMNAHNIARMYGTAYVTRVTIAQVQQAEPIIENLIALYALSYTHGSSLKQAKELMRSEAARTDGNGNGVDFVLAYHKRLEQESKVRLFKGQEAMMAHGYTPEIYSPHVEVLTATELDGEALERRGYTKGGAVENDPADPNKDQKFLYSRQGGGLMPYLTGIVSYTGKSAKGSKKHSGYMNVNTADGLANASLHADIMHAKRRPLAKGPRKDMAKQRGTFMAPIVNPAGEIVNWRYLMQDSTKDSILKRENRFDQVLGTLAGSIYDKSTSLEINTKVFEAMKEMYDSEKATKGHAYVMVGPKSTDAEARDIWAMLPDDTKAEARRIFGRDGMFVRNEMRDIIFGYRKLSLSSAVTKAQDRRQEEAERLAKGMGPLVSQGLAEDAESTLAKLFTLAVEHGLKTHAGVQGYKKPEEYAERAAWLVSRGERMWQELVSETKDLIVIKTVTVMMGNLKSNLSLLVLSGIPLKDIYNNHVIAWNGATSYQKDTEEAFRLQTMLDTGQTNGRDAEIRSQLARVRDAIERNPVKELIEAGLMPTIVEDSAADVDQYSYKSALAEKVDGLTSKLHPLLKEGAKNVYMARDTKIYQGLRRITQLSDFMARYTQYQHLINRKENPLSKEDAIQQSSDDFINYDIPMHRGMTYLDDMGIMPFMKYFLRVQKVIARLARDNPARVLGAVLLGNAIDLGPIVLESSWMHRIGNNPLHWGAFQYPGALDELATIDATWSLVSSGPSFPTAQ